MSPRPRDSDDRPARAPGASRRASGGSSGSADASVPAAAPGVVVDAPDVARRLTRTLATFGTAGLVAGWALSRSNRGPADGAFGRQTALWGAINLGIAGVGAWRSRNHPAQAGRLRRTLLANAALDVGYVAAGAHLAYHRSTLGGRVSRDAAVGHGLAVVGQGLGLLALDLHYAGRLSC